MDDLGMRRNQNTQRKKSHQDMGTTEIRLLSTFKFVSYISHLHDMGHLSVSHARLCQLHDLLQRLL